MSGAGASGDGGSGSGGAGGSCMTESDCPVPSSPCVARVCIGGTCSEVPLSEGTALSSSDQVEGDCKMFVCNADGSIVAQTDENDVPDTGNECTEGHCDGPNPTAPTPLPTRTLCASDRKVCDGSGNCIECTPAEELCSGQPSTCCGGCLPQGTCANCAADGELCGPGGTAPFCCVGLSCVGSSCQFP